MGEQMIKVAIVEDDSQYIDTLKEYIARFMRENGVSIELNIFTDGKQIVFDYEPVYDIILMDIEMAGLDGMSAAEKIRETDRDVIIIFITNMAQYAISGYEVNAVDFILKPVNRYSFAIKIKRAISRTAKKNDNAIQIKMDGTIFLVHMYQIMYLEVDGHYVIFHTTQGDYKEYTTLKLAQKRINSSHFVQCNQSFLINMKYIESVSRESVTVGGTVIYISRKMKTEFMNAVLDFLGGMNP